jgi:arabinose-5-phosphate isomerase
MGIISSGKKTLQIEAEALLEQCNRLDETFEKAVRIVLDGTGKLIVTGMGKSGIVGKKMAATFASTGTPSFFMHPGEAYHGDLGMIEKHDVILALSFSGETDEVLKLIPFIKSNGNKLISITGKFESTLAKNSDVHLALYVS